MCPELLIIGKWLLLWAAKNQLALGWFFSAIMSQMPVEDETKLNFFNKWAYRTTQLLAANVSHLQKKG